MYVKKLWQDEEGNTVEYLLRVVILALGSGSILFAILAALRLKGGELVAGIRSMGF